MNTDLDFLLEEATRLELGVAGLYLLFSESCPQDAELWWQLTMEEENHAALVRAVRESFAPMGLAPDLLAGARAQDLLEVNARVRRLSEQYRQSPPSREEALNTALRLEQSAGEMHFQAYTEREPESPIDRVLQRLNKDDRNHAERIRAYMERNGIAAREESR